MLDRLVEQARALAYPAIELHAQSQAISFYEQVRLCHLRRRVRRMRNQAFSHAPRPGTNGAAATSRTAPSPGGPRCAARRNIDFARAEALAETLALIGAARRYLYIYTRDLDPQLLDTEAALGALKQLAIGGQAGIRILIQEPQQPLRRGHRLIALARRLSSVFALRTPVQDSASAIPVGVSAQRQRRLLFPHARQPLRRRGRQLRAGEARAVARVLQAGLGALGKQRGTASSRHVTLVAVLAGPPKSSGGIDVSQRSTLQV